jgi:hypothetical protein
MEKTIVLLAAVSKVRHASTPEESNTSEGANQLYKHDHHSPIFRYQGGTQSMQTVIEVSIPTRVVMYLANLA